MRKGHRSAKESIRQGRRQQNNFFSRIGAKLKFSRKSASAPMEQDEFQAAADTSPEVLPDNLLNRPEEFAPGDEVLEYAMVPHRKGYIPVVTRRRSESPETE